MTIVDVWTVPKYQLHGEKMTIGGFEDFCIKSTGPMQSVAMRRVAKLWVLMP